MAEATPLIQIRGLKKKLAGKLVHEKIDLDIYEGEILTLMGGSGSGKSVLLRSIIGLEKPDAGAILFNNQNIVGLAETELVEVRKKIAYVFQYGALFDSLTVEENLAYPLREHTKLSDKEIHKRVISTLKKVGLEGSEQQYPAGLSGGMQRRVGVARSIILEPEVILYDEPTTGLDPYNTKQILKNIAALREQGTTSILVTHDMSSIFSITDRVAFLRDGQIIAVGTAREIQNSDDPGVSGFIRGETL